MIEEAYVSFAVSKLLKEKGFDKKCLCYYEDNTSYNEGINFSNWFGKRYSNSEIGRRFAAPTQQMAMRWLREMHYLWIDIDPLTNYKWTWSIWFMNDPNLKMGESSQVITTYEEAVEAAIQYSLKNLI